jgi:hypothetical protein
MMASFGWALLFRAGVGVLITALLLIPLVARMRSEERLLAEHFGAEYESYRARTWAWCLGFIEGRSRLSHPGPAAVSDRELPQSFRLRDNTT